MYHSYCRISRDPDNTSEAIERQMIDNEKKAAELGWEPLEHIVDRNKSAWQKKGSRPGFNELIRLIETGQTEGIIVWSIDRLLRRSDELEVLIDVLDANPIPIQTSSGILNVSDPYNRGMARIQVVIAQMESDIKAMRVKRAMEGKVFTNAYADDPANRDIVAWIAKELISGASYAEIAERLNADGQLTSRGRPWMYTSVRQVISNRRIVPKVIGDRAWVEVQKACELRAVAHGHRQTAHDYILSKLAVCQRCNIPMVGMGQIVRGVYQPRYGCNPDQRVGGCGQSIRADHTEDRVLSWVRDELRKGQLQEISIGGIDPVIADRIAELDDDYYLHQAIDKPTYQKLRAGLQAQAEASPITIEKRMTLKEFEKLDAGGRRLALPRMISEVVVRPSIPGAPRRFDPERLAILGSGAPSPRDAEVTSRHTRPAPLKSSHRGSRSA